jgi:hypothetical protein
MQHMAADKGYPLVNVSKNATVLQREKLLLHASA